ncbi:MAG: glycosyltransferase family 2 protein [Acidobacteria bacterium]|nr:glycosyltransferase family 2 protein [Acidobacteriota bacterium]
MDQARTLAVVIPACNEETTLGSVLRHVDALPCVKEIIVVDDGSLDRTAAVAAACLSPRVRLLRQSRHLGKAAAVRLGVRQVTSPITIIQDAALAYDPREIPFVIEPILAGRADVVYGSRLLARGAACVTSSSLSHGLANKALTLVAGLLANSRRSDVGSSCTAFRTPILQRMPIASRGCGLAVEIAATISKTRARTCEVPIACDGRSFQEARKFGLEDWLATLWSILFYNALAAVGPRRRAGIRAIDEWLSSVRPAAPQPAIATLAVPAAGK